MPDIDPLHSVYKYCMPFSPTMVDEATQQISEMCLVIDSLQEDIKQLEGATDWTVAEFDLKARTISEQITQECIKADSLAISKDLAAEALRQGDRKTTRQVAVLLARRKTAVKKLYGMGDAVDKIKQQAAAKKENANENES